MRLTLRKIFLLFLFVISINSVHAQDTINVPIENDPNGILPYITESWNSLQRSITDCNTLIDTKVSLDPVLYLPADFPMPEAVNDLKNHCPINIKRLPGPIKQFGLIDTNKIQPAGLLYLPHPYVVPGGMFNEMYGWDSYFIIRGLIEEGKIDIAQGMIENFFFEIKYYGGILNGNRTYYLTRTQLPFLAPMIRAVYEAKVVRGQDDLAWLRKGYQYAIRDYNLWTRPPHLAGKTGLSRFYDFGTGPVPELDTTAKFYYADVMRYFILHPDSALPSYLLNPKERTLDKMMLSEYFYKSDRAMRESGFDSSFRFGPFNADTLDYIPVDLNCLLYKAERDLEWMSSKLSLPNAATKWHLRAKLRAQRINRFFWNEERGMYFDYNYKQKHLSKYAYATTFYPLWVGIASRKQAEAVVENLKYFEKPGGIVTSLRETGVQWDAPYGWAPIQLITVEGLHKYGYMEEANRISNKFLSMVINNFLKDKTIREKYNVITRLTQTQIQFGYKDNVTGFGWTNGVFLVLLHRLPIKLIIKELGLKPISKS